MKWHAQNTLGLYLLKHIVKDQLHKISIKTNYKRLITKNNGRIIDIAWGLDWYQVSINLKIENNRIENKKIKALDNQTWSSLPIKP